MFAEDLESYLLKFKMMLSQSVDTFYDPVEDGHDTPESVALTEEEKKRQEEEWKQELQKVRM